MSKVICLGVRGDNRAQLNNKNIGFQNSPDLGEGMEVGRILELSNSDKTGSGDFSKNFVETECGENVSQ